MSAVAQELELPITSANKLINSDHVIYMMTEQNTPM
jgi:alpha-tubulin N-acetyltransferase 1